MAARRTFVLRAEGVNFDATIDDTRDLSTIRGASLCLLWLDTAMRRGLNEPGLGLADVRQIFSGASQCALRFEALPADAEKALKAVRVSLASRGPGISVSIGKRAETVHEPFDHMTFVVDAVEADGSDDAAIAEALSRVEARNRSRQFRQWTVPLPDFDAGARLFDRFDRVRPGALDARLPKGKLRRDEVAVLDEGDPAEVDATGSYDLTRLSHSVFDRRFFGRRMRQGFYQREVPLEARDVADGLRFVDSFEDIVADPPPEIPETIGSKMAVFYADGNGFGDIRAKRGSDAAFAAELKKLRAGLLAQILAWFRSDGEVTALGTGKLRPLDSFKRSTPFVAHERKRQRAGLRFETLLWGGDEVLFVLPAWLALRFAELFFHATRGWRIAGEPLTHTVGLVLCNRKTPIRQVRRLAKYGLADPAKEAMASGSGKTDAIAFEIFESIAPPEDDIDAHRARLYPHHASRFTREELTRHLTLPGSTVGSVVTQLLTIADEDPAAGTGNRHPNHIPRSQIYRALNRARDAADPDAAAERILRDYAVRVRDDEALPSALRLPTLDGDRPVFLDIALIAQLWDYAQPIDTFGWPQFKPDTAP